MKYGDLFRVVTAQSRKGRRQQDSLRGMLVNAHFGNELCYEKKKTLSFLQRGTFLGRNLSNNDVVFYPEDSRGWDRPRICWPHLLILKPCGTASFYTYILSVSLFTK